MAARHDLCHAWLAVTAAAVAGAPAPGALAPPALAQIQAMLQPILAGQLVMQAGLQANVALLHNNAILS